MVDVKRGCLNGQPLLMNMTNFDLDDFADDSGPVFPLIGIVAAGAGVTVNFGIAVSIFF